MSHLFSNVNLVTIKGTRSVKTEWWVLAWLSVWSEVQICMWPSLSHCHYCHLLQEIQIDFGFIFLVPAYPGSPGQNPEGRKMVVVY